MPPHTVSVIVPTYNRAPLIARAIKSVLAQSVPVHELIVVDDGSDDDTEAVVRQYAEQDARVQFAAQSHAGAPAARNLGIAMATGTLLAFQDSDDEWDPTFVEKLIRYHEQPGRVVFASMLSNRPSGSSVVEFPERIANVEHLLCLKNCISTQTALVDADLLRTRAFDEELPRLQDWDLWLGLVGSAEFIHHPEVLVVQHIQRDSITRGEASLYRALRMITRKHWRVLARRPASFLKLSIAAHWKTRKRA